MGHIIWIPRARECCFVYNAHAFYHFHTHYAEYLYRACHTCKYSYTLRVRVYRYIVYRVVRMRHTLYFGCSKVMQMRLVRRKSRALPRTPIYYRWINNQKMALKYRDVIGCDGSFRKRSIFAVCNEMYCYISIVAKHNLCVHKFYLYICTRFGALCEWFLMLVCVLCVVTMCTCRISIYAVGVVITYVYRHQLAIWDVLFA